MTGFVKTVVYNELYRDLFLAVFLGAFFAAFLAVFFAAFLAPFFGGTFAPFSLASDNPIAIACLRLVTFFPVPVFSDPSFFLCMARFTLPPAPFEYFAITFILIPNKTKKLCRCCIAFSLHLSVMLTTFHVRCAIHRMFKVKFSLRFFCNLALGLLPDRSFGYRNTTINGIQ